ncbi:MAG TPA: hypothetical protein PKZ44_10600 [Flavobacterium sp.]|nr:hypothetical protein [Flavobacterium sp.]
MKNITLLLTLFLFVSFSSFAQRFYLGDRLNAATHDFKLMGISSSTGVSAYQFIGLKTEPYLYGRKIGDIIVGIKNGIIVTTVYSLIPEKGDIGVPKSTLDLFQSAISQQLIYRNGIYGANIDNINVTLSRSTNEMTFNKDRIMFFTSYKNSLLKQ